MITTTKMPTADGPYLSSSSQVTDGYVSVVQPATERRKAIRERYGFDLTGDRILLEDQLFSEETPGKWMGNGWDMDGGCEFFHVFPGCNMIPHDSTTRPSISVWAWVTFSGWLTPYDFWAGTFI